MAVNNFISYAFHLFGGYFKKRRTEYFGIRQDLLKTRMNISYDMYLSLALLCSLIMALFGLLLAVTIISLFGTPEIVFSRSILTDMIEGFHQYKNLAMKAVTIAGLVILFGGCTYIVFLQYPKVVNGDRRRRIDQMLPYAVHYMSAMSGAGVIPIDIFTSLARNNIYKEASVEAGYIVRDIKMLGHDLVHALKNVASTTPSYRLQEFLQGATTIVSSGGNLEAYLKIKADQFVIENQREQKEFLETLGLVAETYVTAFVAGPLFLIVMISVMITMGGMNILILYLLVYLIIPVASLMFVILVSSLTPEM